MVNETAGHVAELPPPVMLSTMGFHDLGWHEFLCLAVVVVSPTRWWGRDARRPGIFLGVFALLYAPMRFALDALRVSDSRCLGRTPAQCLRWRSSLRLRIGFGAGPAYWRSGLLAARPRVRPSRV